MGKGRGTGSGNGKTIFFGFLSRKMAEAAWVASLIFFFFSLMNLESP